MGELKTVKISEETIEGVKSRTILWYLVFFGFAINYVVRINQSMAIVDMIDRNYRKTGNDSGLTSECIISRNESSQGGNSSIDEVYVRYVSMEKRFLESFGFEYEKDGFKWDEHQINAVQGAFYWLNFATQIPGGILAAKYGTKVVFGWGNYIAILLCFITPISAYIDYRLLVFIRIVSGATTGVVWPSAHNLVGKWIPSNERSRFVSAYLGSSIGVAIFYPLFGYIIKISSWEWVFHFSFIVGTIWFVLWQYFVFDSPEHHPRIDPSEKGYILEVLGSTVVRNTEEKVDIPWKAILTSKTVWVSTVCQIGGLWGLFTLVTQTPAYFSFIHGWSPEMTGLLSGIPHLLRTAFSMFLSLVSDYLLTGNKMTRTNVRRLSTFFHLVLNGVFTFGLAYVGCDIILAVGFLTVSLAFHGAVSSGVLASMVDNSPNYSGIVLGITSTIAITTGFISPMVVAHFTYQNQTVEAWQHIWEISAVIMIVTGLFFMIFNDASLQKWNKPPKNKYDEINQKDDLNLILLDTMKNKEVKESEKEM